MAQKILIIQTAFLGDLLLSIPLIKNTRRLFPNAEIHLLCRKGFGEFFEKLGLVQKAIEINKSDKASVHEAANQIKSYQYEVVLCPHQSFRSAYFARLAKSKIRIGFSTWWNAPFFNVRVKKPNQLPDALRQLSLLRTLDKDINMFFTTERASDHFLSVSSDIPDWASMHVSVSADSSIPQKFNLSGKLAFIAPGSVWNTKRWIQEKYVELGKRLQADGYNVVVIGSPEEVEYAGQIANQIIEAKNIAGLPTLYELIQLLNYGKVLISNDNGAMHLGSVAGIPTVAVFGPTTLDLGYRPWNKNARVVQDEQLKCRPCGKHGHKVCPVGTHECMKNVSVDKVYEATAIARP